MGKQEIRIKMKIKIRKRIKSKIRIKSRRILVDPNRNLHLALNPLPNLNLHPNLAPSR